MPQAHPSLTVKPEVTAEPGGDWPDWMNPILVKELRQSLRSRWFEIIFLGLCGGLTLVTVLGGEFATSMTTRIFFWSVIVFTLHLLLPLRTALSASDDRHPGNLELIRVAGVSAEKLASQRITALLFHAAVLSCVILPFVFLRYFAGGIDLVDELQYLALLLFSTPVFGLAVLWMSVVGGLGRAFLGVMFLFLAPAYEALIGSAAFAPFDDALLALVLWIFATFIGCIFIQAFVTEAFLLGRTRAS